MWSLFLGLAVLASLGAACLPSVTTVSGTHAPTTFCPGDLIFADEFVDFNLEIWQHEITLAGGDHNEFQFYDNNRTNSFAHDGILYIRPSLSSDQFGEDFLWKNTLNIEGNAPADSCTYRRWKGCERTGTRDKVLNPVKSARLRTVNSFSFRYGIIEVRAKMPAGDWLWPAIWLKPTFNSYGSWPASGEIDLVESRGNKNLTLNGENIGTQDVGANLHFAPYRSLNAWRLANWVKKNSSGYDTDFHRYQLEWTPEYIRFSLDGKEFGKITPP
ncbi:hypothetical protein O0L34_g16278 [Tuta absoluta]|nr:hypothetical protein O0L34_g16278 [Tuta absoluta]